MRWGVEGNGGGWDSVYVRDSSSSQFPVKDKDDHSYYLLDLRCVCS